MVNYDKISLKYDEKAILEQFSLSVNAGDKVLIKGRSGCGKSTLLKIALGFENRYSGTVYIDNEHLNAKNVWELRKKIAYIPQMVEFNEEILEDWFRFVFGWKHFSSSLNNIDEKIVNALEKAGLDKKYLKYECSRLSGGEKQRAAAAAALVTERKIILMDEATASIDKSGKEEIASIFCRDNRYTVIAVSHDEIWEGYCSRIIDLGGNNGGL